jgi:hypothetical protein
MAGTAPRLPEQFRASSQPIDFVVSELVSDAPGAHSPYGNLELPLPPEKLLYKHPSPEERPRLANGR